jgi:hypothetical protein
MSLFRVIAFVVALAFVVGAHSVMPIAAYASSLVSSIPNGSGPGPIENEILGPDADGIDVFGNEVDEAVCDYRVDVRGDVYERHSPETEVPKLRPPVG